MTHLRTWRFFAPLGLALIGFGASLLGYAAELRILGAAFGIWFVWGTLALVVLNSGVAVFGEAVKHRALWDLRQAEPPAPTDARPKPPA